MSGPCCRRSFKPSLPDPLRLAAAAVPSRTDAEQDIGKQKNMKAFILDRYKKKGALRFGDMPEPPLRDGDVLVEIHAAGLNQLDAKIRDGEFKAILPYRLPLILGNDVAGGRGRGRGPKCGASVQATKSMRGRGTAKLIKAGARMGGSLD
jgi:hypothetical protein